MSIQQEKFKEIADKIRQIKESQEPIIPDNFADEIENVYEKGKNDGITLGEKQQYDEFWDEFQDYGNRTNYAYAFSGYGFTNKNFNPKYDICPTRAENMFYCNNNENTQKRFDMNDLKVTFDFSKCEDMSLAFTGSIIRNLGVIDLTSATSTYMCFYEGYHWLRREIIEKIIVNENTPFNNTFTYASGLKYMKFEGEIGQNGLNLQWSVSLSAESIVSVIEALKNTPNISNPTVTLSDVAVNNADWSNTNYRNFDELVATKPNWTISLL